VDIRPLLRLEVQPQVKVGPFSIDLVVGDAMIAALRSSSTAINTMDRSVGLTTSRASA
jgi:hypothetical protein